MSGCVLSVRGKETPGALTIDATLELLAADLALEFAYASLLVQLDCDRLLVVAEQACECRWQWFVLFDGDDQLLCSPILLLQTLSDVVLGRRTFFGP